ncbi:MAG: AAA family ATPase [Armatimonadetes bacterium]|nr:AAA family ATPase [Armatimonadota bacterium]
MIFVSHPEPDREGADDFEELFAVRCSGINEQRTRHESELSRLTDQLLEQWRLKFSIPELTKKIEELEKAIGQDSKDKGRLVSKDQEARVGRHEALQHALVARKAAWEVEQKKVRALKSLQGDLNQFSTRTAVAFLDDLKQQRRDAGLKDEEWQKFTPKIGQEADKMVNGKLEAATKSSAAIFGSAIQPQPEDKLTEPMFPDEANLHSLTICQLQAESDRLAKLIGVDQQNAKRFTALTLKIQQAQKQMEGLKSQLSTALKADEETKKISLGRREVYRQVFETFVELQAELSMLYAPLTDALEAERGALGKLRFVVRRVVDLDRWVERGESLLDLRKDGPFKGRGTLRAAAEQELLAAWASGEPNAADKAVDSFIEKYREDIRAHRLDSFTAQEWGARIWEWLLGTDHIKVTYGLQYGGVDIERLSPGTRGIVLLLLYLAIDKDDIRPLIIDQPEENLDPQSVYDELVQRFRDSRKRRQIIIVTHNANLVVNTDADQVIVATAGEHGPGQLPEIRYEAGGLEGEYVRRKVCEILEGGEEAFKARARRLRVVLS